MFCWTESGTARASSGGGFADMSKTDILRGIVTERLSTAAREILAVVERTVRDYEAEAAGFRREIERQRRQMELLQPEVKLWRQENHKDPAAEGPGVVLVQTAVREQSRRPPSVDPHSPEEPEEVESLSPLCDPEVEVDQETAENASSSRQDPGDPDYQLPSRSDLEPRRRRSTRPRVNPEPADSVYLKIRLLEDPEIQILNTAVFQKYPLHELFCPRGLQEPQFLALLRSTFPRLAGGELFHFFLSDRGRSLQPLRATPLTPEEIEGYVGSNTLYLRLQSSGESAVGESAGVPATQTQEAQPAPLRSSPHPALAPAPDPTPAPASAPALAPGPAPAPDPTPAPASASVPAPAASEKRKRKRKGMKKVGHCSLRICILEGVQAERVLDPVLRRTAVKELCFPWGLKEHQFLSQLQSAYPDLEVQRGRLVLFRSDRHLKLQKVQPRRWTPEEIMSSSDLKCGQKRIVYIQPKSRDEDEEEEEESDSTEEENEAPGSDGAAQEGGESSPSSNAADSTAVTSLPPLRPPLPPKMEGDRLSCHVCGGLYLSVGVMVKHALRHVNDPEPVCGVCGERSESAQQLREHLQQHQPTHPCSVCGKVFLSEKRLSVHRSLHSNSQLFSCTVCGRNYSSSFSLSLHRQSHQGELPFKCDSCPKSFALRGHLTAHLKIHRGLNKLRCNICGKMVSGLRSLARHQVTHGDGERKHACQVCGKRFLRDNALRQHMKIHTERERRFLCHVCCKTFVEEATLKAHLRRHSEERPFVCSHCGRAFKFRSALDVHVRVHTGERPFACQTCDRSFKCKSALNMHMRSHMGVKSYVCNVCGKASLRPEHLAVHMRTHNGERPYKCQLCERAFTQSHCLKTHMQKHHGEGRGRGGGEGEGEAERTQLDSQPITGADTLTQEMEETQMSDLQDLLVEEAPTQMCMSLASTMGFIPT